MLNKRNAYYYWHHQKAIHPNITRSGKNAIIQITWKSHYSIHLHNLLCAYSFNGLRKYLFVRCPSLICRQNQSFFKGAHMLILQGYTSNEPT